VQNSLGSGVIVDASGLIVTNHHVIQDADEVRVVLADRREFDAKILLSDDRTDMAVLKIDTKGERLPTIEIGDSDQLEVGDLVLAIGDPFGVGQTVTSGIVSGLARTAVGLSDIGSFIQTDAPINPGNSGGALVDLDGRLVGINTAIFSQSGGSIGIGFAIPASMVRIAMHAATAGGHISRPWFGASGQAVTAEIASGLGLDRPSGVLIKDVSPDSPASQCGIHIGDVILDIDGHEVEDPEGLRFRIATVPANTIVHLTVWHNGQSRKVNAELTLPPEVPARQIVEVTGRNPLAGASVGNLNPAFDEELSLDPTTRGVVVSKVRGGSPAERLGLEAGDILASLNRHELESVSQLQSVLAGSSGPWVVTVRRNGQLISVTVR
jgi:serine protease Do